MRGMHVKWTKTLNDVMCPFDALYVSESESTQTRVSLVFFLGVSDQRETFPSQFLLL